MNRRVVRSETELRAALTEAYSAGLAVYVAGGGEPPASGDSVELEVATRGIDIETEGCNVDDLVFCGAVTVRLAAGEPWGEFVRLAVENGWAGVEALAGEPGTVGAIVAANPVRFGQSPADTVTSVRTWDRSSDSQRTFAMVDCGFAAGSSLFAREQLADGSPRYAVIEVALLLKQADVTASIDDPQLAEALSVAQGARVPLAHVREVALASAAQVSRPELPPERT